MAKQRPPVPRSASGRSGESCANAPAACTNSGTVEATGHLDNDVRVKELTKRIKKMLGL